jgi:uncharacterized protein YaaN involved in tellurite resistance
MPRADKSKTNDKLTRRDFARGVTLAAMTSVVPLTHAAASDATQQNSAQAAQLSPEFEAQFQAIIRRYGARLSEEQRADIRRLLDQAQKTSEALRSFQLENSDEPATIFHPYRPEKSTPARRRRDS